MSGDTQTDRCEKYKAILRPAASAQSVWPTGNDDIITQEHKLTVGISCNLVLWQYHLPTYSPCYPISKLRQYSLGLREGPDDISALSVNLAFINTLLVLNNDQLCLVWLDVCCISLLYQVWSSPRTDVWHQQEFQPAKFLHWNVSRDIKQFIKCIATCSALEVHSEGEMLMTDYSACSNPTFAQTYAHTW